MGREGGGLYGPDARYRFSNGNHISVVSQTRTDVRIALWIALGIAGLYLLLVIPAGLAVLIRELRFRRSPDRSVVLGIIRDYQCELAETEESVLEVVQRSRRDTVERGGVRYSVDVTAKKLKVPRSYKIFVSVGQLRPITIGHGESFKVSFS